MRQACWSINYPCKRILDINEVSSLTDGPVLVEVFPNESLGKEIAPIHGMQQSQEKAYKLSSYRSSSGRLLCL